MILYEYLCRDMYFVNTEPSLDPLYTTPVAYHSIPYHTVQRLSKPTTTPSVSPLYSRARYPYPAIHHAQRKSNILKQCPYPSQSQPNPKHRIQSLVCRPGERIWVSISEDDEAESSSVIDASRGFPFLSALPSYPLPRPPDPPDPPLCKS